MLDWNKRINPRRVGGHGYSTLLSIYGKGTSSIPYLYQLLHSRAVVLVICTGVIYLNLYPDVLCYAHLLYHIYLWTQFFLYSDYHAPFLSGLFRTILDYSRSAPWDLKYSCPFITFFSCCCIVVVMPCRRNLQFPEFTILFYRRKMFIGNQSLNLKQ